MKRKIDRREFLTRIGLAAASLPLFSSGALSASPPDLQKKGSPKEIIIVGAGLGGLSAAYELERAGHQIKILEARLRPGGRVYTLREPFSDGMYAEAGAGRIPDHHQWTMKYIKLFNLTLDPFHPEQSSSLAYIRGKRIKVAPGQDIPLSGLPLNLTQEERRLGVTGIWEHYVAAAMQEIKDPALLNRPPAELRKYDRMTFAEFLRQQGASAAATALLELPYYKPEDDPISALWWLREAVLLKDQKQEYKIRGGNDLLPKAFAARLTEKIIYGAPVLRIEQDARGVRVMYKQAGTQQRLTADYLICAVPFTTLRKIEISPAFSVEKQQVIEQHAYDSVTRVFLQMRKRPWENEGLNGFAVTDTPEQIWHPTFDHPGLRSILFSYSCGAQARKLAALGKEARISYMIKHMEEVFPGVRENCEGGTSFSWDEDEWARGAYSILKPGQMQTFLPHIASPEGRVHFAGEHASAWPGWMQGAIESGNRVAQAVNDAS